MDERNAGAGDTRPCPFCRESIKLAARKCRWCGSMLDGSDAPPDAQRKAGPAVPAATAPLPAASSVAPPAAASPPLPPALAVASLDSTWTGLCIAGIVASVLAIVGIHLPWKTGNTGFGPMAVRPSGFSVAGLEMSFDDLVRESGWECKSDFTAIRNLGRIVLIGGHLVAAVCLGFFVFALAAKAEKYLAWTRAGWRRRAAKWLGAAGAVAGMAFIFWPFGTTCQLALGPGGDQMTESLAAGFFLFVGCSLAMTGLLVALDRVRR